LENSSDEKISKAYLLGGGIGSLAAYQLLDIEREVPPVRQHDKSLQTQLGVLVNAFK
jgi:hypothetical protein